MTFQQIQCIIEIFKCGSINKAAQKLYIAQPYLSKILKEIEEEIGIIIFKRTSKGIKITEDGQEFINYISPLIEQRDRILEIYSSHKINSSFSFSISTQRYPFVIKGFMDFFKSKKFDKYKIHIKEEGMYQVINDIQESKSDLGIIFVSKFTESFIKKILNSKNIEFGEIIKLTPCVFFNNRHPLAKYSTITIEEILEYSFVSFEEQIPLSMEFAEEFLTPDLSLIEKRIFVKDRGTMINILTNTNSFSIGSGILPLGYAGINLISKPLDEYKDNIKLLWLKNKEVECTANDKEIIKNIIDIIKKEKIKEYI